MGKLIAFSGVKNVGKSCSAGFLKFLLNTPKCFHHYWIYKLFPNLILTDENWTEVSFAGTLKEMLAVLLKVPVEMFESRDFKENVFVDFNTLTFYRRDELTKNQILSDSKFSKKINEMSIDVTTNLLSIRQLLQYWGTEIMRKYFGDQLWCLTTLKLADTQDLIISDLRFLIEAEMVKERGGKIIYISRPGCKVGNHQSEKEAFMLYETKQCDYVIHNDGTLEDLFNECKRICYDLE